MDDAALLAEWRSRFEAPTAGWDFSELDGAMTADEPPWSYADLARAALRGAGSALDMGTGGGEVLLDLADALPTDSLATEGWPPNLPVARENLAHVGIEVVPYDAESNAVMPFPNGRFDVVLNRHEAYDVTDVARILRPGGRFLTQQVDGRDFEETQALFGGASAYPHVTLDRFRADAEATGLILTDARECIGLLRFDDIATMVRYFRIVPWEVPDDFGVDRYSDVLLDLHHSGRDLVFTQRRFVLKCIKP